MRILALTVLTLAAAGGLSSPSRAADECKGLQVCIPVAGPWVANPSARDVSTAVWQLKCPVGVVAGLDARVSDPEVRIRFPGLVGSPVNPGITTTDRVVFTATYAGRQPKTTAFRPFIGCIPTSGGRTPATARAAPALPPGEAITTRVKTLRVQPGRLARATLGCEPGERLLSAVHAIGLYSRVVPAPPALSAVHVVQAVVDQQILISATRHGLPPGLRVEVQLLAECAR